MKNSNATPAMTGRFLLPALLAALVFIALAACGGGEDVAAVAREKGLLTAYAPPMGIQQNVPVSAVQADGWTLCYADTYAGSATPLPTILSGCGSPPLLMLACLPSGGALLTLAAAAPTVDAVFDVGPGPAAFHTANGVSWYYSADRSWGFFVPGETVNRNTCDTDAGAFSSLRMCIHTGAAVGAPSATLGWGYRCGDTLPPMDASWERRIYKHL